VPFKQDNRAAATQRNFSNYLHILYFNILIPVHAAKWPRLPKCGVISAPDSLWPKYQIKVINGLHLPHFGSATQGDQLTSV
jgi:hypothetical protein